MRRNVVGFTLIELLVTIAIAVIMITVVIPAFSNIVERRVLIRAAEAVYHQSVLARSEAIRLRTPVFINFYSASSGAIWSVGLNETTGCSPQVTDPADASSCTLDENGTNVLRAVRSTDYSNISLTSASFGSGSETRFEHVRGTASDGMGTFYNGTARFESSNGDKLELQISQMGRIKLCIPSGAPSLQGFSSC